MMIYQLNCIAEFQDDYVMNKISNVKSELFQNVSDLFQRQLLIPCKEFKDTT